MKRIIVIAINMAVCTVGISILLFAILLLAGIRPYVVLSGSMEPVIRTGSLCFVYRRADYEDICTGDIIAFHVQGGNLVTHRVIAVTEEGLETKGDANELSDGITTTERNFEGKTLFCIPGLGYFSRFYRTGRGRAVMLFLLAGVFLVEILESTGGKQNNRRKKKENEEKI